MSTVFQDQHERRRFLVTYVNKVCPKRSIMQEQHIQSIGDLHAPSVHCFSFLEHNDHDEQGKVAVKILERIR